MSTVEAMLDQISVDSNGVNEFIKDVSLFLQSPLVPPSSDFSVSPEFPPSLPLLPPLPQQASVSTPPPLVPFSTLTHLSTPLRCMDAQSSFQSSALSWQENPLAPCQPSKPSLAPPGFVSQVLTLLHHGLPHLWLCFVSPSLCLHQAPSFFQHCLGPRSLRLHPVLPSSPFQLGLLHQGRF